MHAAPGKTANVDSGTGRALSSGQATARIDRREKLYAYTQIPSLQEYLLLAQDRIEADLHRRQGEAWETLRFTEGAVPCTCVDLDIPLATVYEDVPLRDAGSRG